MEPDPLPQWDERSGPTTVETLVSADPTMHMAHLSVHLCACAVGKA